MYLVNGNKIWYPGIFPGHDSITASLKRGKWMVMFNVPLQHNAP